MQITCLKLMFTLICLHFAHSQVTKIAYAIDSKVYTRAVASNELGFQSLLSCLSNKAKYECSGSFKDLLVQVNFINFRNYPPVNSCISTKEINGKLEIVMKGKFNLMEIYQSSTMDYVDIIGNPHLCSCFSLFRPKNVSTGDNQKITELKRNHCKTLCCHKVLGYGLTNSSTLPSNTSKAVTTSISTTPRIVIITVDELSSETTAGVQATPEVVSHVKKLTSVDTVTNHQHEDSHQITILITCIVTIILALGAIIISSIVCWRNRKRRRINLLTPAQVFVTPPPLSEPQRENVYSALRMSHDGSIHRYAGLTPREYDRVIYNGASALSGAFVGYTNDQVQSASVYDEVNVFDNSYLQLK